MAFPDDTLPADIGLRQLRTRVHGRLFGTRLEPVRIGRYEVSEYLGAGGMGVVYAARDPELDRKVAIKLLRSDGIKETARVRLRREAKALAKLSHPNVVQVYEVGSDEGQVFVAMEYVEGATLGQWLEDDPHTVDEILEIFVAVGRGLSAAHTEGLVHRDFKPDNVLIDGSGRPRVLDFGLVISADDQTATHPDPSTDREGEGDAPLSLTKTGTLIGTPAYMAPEQHRGAPADARADIFAYCVALYEALYGIRPFGGDSYEVLAAAVLLGRVVPPPADKVHRVPRRIRDAVVRGLAIEPADRFQTIDELLDALTHASRRRRHPLWWGIGAGVVGGAFALGAFMRPDAEAEPTATPTGEVCQAASAKLEGTWDDDVRAQVRSAFLQTQQPFADVAFGQVAANLDAWTAKWMDAWGGACERALGQDSETAELGMRQMRCLDLQLTELDQLTDVFGEADAPVVTRAADASAQLGSLGACQGPRAVVPDLVTDESRAVEFQLARAVGFLNARRRSQATSLAREALASAQRLQRTDLQARARLLIARAATFAADPAKTIETLHEVVLLARAAEDPRTEAEAYIEMIGRVTDRRMSPSEDEVAAELGVLAKLAPAWAKMARSLLEGVDDGRLELELDYRLAELYREQSAFESAREQLARAEKLAAVHAASGSPIHAHLEAALGRVEAGAGEYAQAEKLFRGARKKYELMLGKDHPDTIEAKYWIAAVADDSVEARKLATEVYATSVTNQRIDADDLVRAAETVELIRRKGWNDDAFEAELETVLEAAGAKKAKEIADATRRVVKRRVDPGGDGASAVIVISDGVTLRMDDDGATVSVDTDKVDWTACPSGGKCKRKTWKWTTPRLPKPPVPPFPRKTSQPPRPPKPPVPE